MNEQPLISVVITCHDYKEYVAQAVDSVLAQTYSNIELIIIDDGSTDGSLSVIEKYRDRARIVSHENRGIVSVRNEALTMVGGEFICFLDADDYFSEGYVEQMCQVAETYGADVVYPNWRMFGEGREESWTDFAEFEPRLLQLQRIHCTAESLIRFSAIGPHRFESEEVAEDWDFFVGLSLAGARFKLARDCFINYRLKKNGRGARRDMSDDVACFAAILRRYQARYPADVIDPEQLVIEKLTAEHQIRTRLRHEVDGLREEIGDVRREVEALQREVYNVKQDRDYLRARNEDLVQQLDRIEGSRSFRAARIAALPWRIARELRSH